MKKTTKLASLSLLGLSLSFTVNAKAYKSEINTFQDIIKTVNVQNKKHQKEMN